MSAPRVLVNEDAARSFEDDVKVLAEFQHHGIPVFAFTLRLDAKGNKGFPAGWQHTEVHDSNLNGVTPGCAFGILGGHGVDVIDVDPRNGGNVEKVHDQLLAFEVPIIAIVSTPGGGAHFYISSTGRAKKTNLAPGVDYIGGTSEGKSRGFVFAPGTSRPTYLNARYAWVLEPQWELLGTGVEQAQAYLASLTTATVRTPMNGQTPDDLDVVVEIISKSEEGERNTTLFTQTVRLAIDNKVNEEVHSSLVQAALACGLPSVEIKSTINSALTTAGRQHEAAHVWRDTVLTSQKVKASRSLALPFTILIFTDLFARFGDKVGLSVRQLATEINFDITAASKAIKALVDMGFLVRQPGQRYAPVAARFAMVLPALEEPQGPESDLDEGAVGKGNSPSVPNSISVGSTDDCCSFAPLLDRALEIHRHDAFTRDEKVSLPHGCALTLAAIEAGATTINAIVDVTGQGRSTIRGHLKVLSSANLIAYQQGSPIVPAWDGDVLDALDDWCNQMGIGPRAAARSREYKVQQAAYQLRLTSPMPLAGLSRDAHGDPLTFVSLVRDFDAATEKYEADIRAQAESQVERRLTPTDCKSRSTSTPKGISA